MQTTGKRVDRQPSKTSSISINEEELQDLRVEVVESIDTLFDLVQSLLRPAPHDRILDSLTEELPAFSTAFDERHVQDKFPHALEELTKRLGFANSLRRKWLSNSQVRYERLRMREIEEQQLALKRLYNIAKLIPPSIDNSFLDSGIAMSSTVSLKEKMLNTEPSPGDETPAFDDEAHSDKSDASATSYAVTVTQELSGGSTYVPLPPGNFYQELPFHCPYCFEFLTNIRSMKAWK